MAAQLPVELNWYNEERVPENTDNQSAGTEISEVSSAENNFKMNLTVVLSLSHKSQQTLLDFLGKCKEEKSS